MNPMLFLQNFPGDAETHRLRRDASVILRVSASPVKSSVLAALIAVFLLGCGNRVDVVDSQSDLHLSGNWNDSDSRAVAEGLAEALATAPWIAAFTEARGRAPVLRVGRIHVRTRALDDIVDPAVFTADLERALIASGRVRVVTSASETAIQRDERADLADQAASAPALHAGLAADVVLTGTLLTQDDRVLDRGLSGTYRQVKFYQLDLAVSDLTTTELLWRGAIERKKTIEQSTVGW